MKIKRWMALVMAALMLMTMVPVQSRAAGTDGGTGAPAAAGTLADGYYSVPILMDNFSLWGNTQPFLDKYRTALVHVENGRQTVTIRVGSMKGSAKQIKILKEEYYTVFLQDGKLNSSYTALELEKADFEKADYWRTL